ncbi:MAG TPA: DUF4276 family protein [Symbiobacteriaceae bacterium]|jgi:hypothetical protein
MLDILVEELSAEYALRQLVPKVTGKGVPFRIVTFQGKPDLLKKLPERLRGYSAWHQAPKVVVLVDRDDDDCGQLKADLERMAMDAGLTTKTVAPPGQPFQVVNRIAIEELEAWFFGDLDAVRTAYPKVPATLNQKEAFRDPDAIRGGTAESLERVLQKAGHIRGRLNKTQVAQVISEHMEPDRNQSLSFQVFCEALRQLAPAR